MRFGFPRRTEGTIRSPIYLTLAICWRTGGWDEAAQMHVRPGQVRPLGRGSGTWGLPIRFFRDTYQKDCLAVLGFFKRVFAYWCDSALGVHYCMEDLSSLYAHRKVPLSGPPQDWNSSSTLFICVCQGCTWSQLSIKVGSLCTLLSLNIETKTRLSGACRMADLFFLDSKPSFHSMCFSSSVQVMQRASFWARGMVGEKFS